MKSFHEGQLKPFWYGIRALLDSFFKYSLGLPPLRKYPNFGLSEYSLGILSANSGKQNATSRQQRLLGCRSPLWLSFGQFLVQWAWTRCFLRAVFSVGGHCSWAFYRVTIFSWKSTFGVGWETQFVSVDRSTLADEFTSASIMGLDFGSYIFPFFSIFKLYWAIICVGPISYWVLGLGFN